ncbi:hypothetical protein OROMI_026445 [Orobanche minor]
MKPNAEATFSSDYARNDQTVSYNSINHLSDSLDKSINHFAGVTQFSDFGDIYEAVNQPNNYFDDHGPFSDATLLGENLGGKPPAVLLDSYSKSKRKRPRSRKTSEQVESQRMTHITVERNRRKQMNEHLHILKSLMPTSYVQRGDQASIIGGAIEFVRELEQLVQCLESQKRRRLYGDSPIMGDNSLVGYYRNGLLEEKSEIKSCLGNVEVKVIGVDGLMINILSRTRPGQLIRSIAAIEDLQLNIIHANVTTIEQNVLYSFKVKMNGEALRFTAEDVANSTQKILSDFINTSSSIALKNNVLEY